MSQYPLSDKAKGYIIPNISVLLIACITRYTQLQESGALVFSEFVILPMLMGIFSAWFWRKVPYTTNQTIGRSCYLSLIAIGLSFFFLGEGAICLVIVSPLVFVFVAVGVAFGRGMFNRGKIP